MSNAKLCSNGVIVEPAHSCYKKGLVLPAPGKYLIEYDFTLKADCQKTPFAMRSLIRRREEKETVIDYTQVFDFDTARVKTGIFFEANKNRDKYILNVELVSPEAVRIVRGTIYITER